MGEQGDIFASNNLPTVDELTVAQYEALAKTTDRLKKTKHVLDLPLLGLFGEIGGTVAEVKKLERGDRPTAAYTSAVKQELGDALWYCAAVCQRLNISLSEVACKAAKLEPSDKGKVRFADLQKPYSRQARISEENLLELSIAMTEQVGAFVGAYNQSRGETYFPAAADNIATLLSGMFEMATCACVSVQEAASENLLKIFDRWPLQRNYPPLLDSEDKEIERLPRKLVIEIFEREVSGKTYVYQRCGGINIGDPLTDNKEDADDYRFHDVFHYAYAAVLGWSPVLRALFKLKRKSNRSKDENQDGARAILIEEGIATWVFGQAQSQDLFSRVERGKLSYDLLKSVRQFVSGYEVDSCPLWVWEEAILAGFRCFRFLKENRSGRVTINLNSRTIEIEPHTRSVDGERPLLDRS